MGSGSTSIRPMTDLPASPIEVETWILSLCEALEEQIDLYRQLSQQRAVAEADYRHRHARAVLEQQGKPTTTVREAVADYRASAEFRQWRILEAQEKATLQAMSGIRSRLEALRTVAANVRAATH